MVDKVPCRFRAEFFSRNVHGGKVYGRVRAFGYVVKADHRIIFGDFFAYRRDTFHSVDGYYIVGADGREIKRGGDFLGMSNSRLAEYYGLKEGIEQALELGLRRVSFVSDSLMMVNQMNGVYKVKNKDLMQVYNDVLQLLTKLDSYSFTHVPHSQNREADEEVNRVIDENITRGEY